MLLSLHQPEKDLWVPLPTDPESIDVGTVHTHYFNFTVPEAGICGHLYITWQPAFKKSKGGVVIFRGQNVEQVDADHLNYWNEMRWPTIEGNTITTQNGFSVEFLELGRVVRLRYEGSGASFDITQTAISPLAARGQVFHGEEENSDPTSEPGGLEQFMHAVGTLTLGDETFDVDCFSPRDRSWNQVRTEAHDAVRMPPVAWTPICFGEDFSFNQVGWEHPDTNPPWLADYDLPADKPTFIFGWVHADKITSRLVSVRREVHRRHPTGHLALEQTMTATDEEGREFSFTGTAVSFATIPAWPTLNFHDTLYRWEDAQGRVAYATCQEAWFDRDQHRFNSLSAGRFPDRGTL